MSFAVTWKIIDAGYSFTEALTNYDSMEKIVRAHYEKYEPDCMMEYGTRNPYLLTEAIGASNYVVNDEVQAVTYKEIPMATHEDLQYIIKDPKKFIWEKGMAAKFPTWNKDFTVADFQKAYDAYMGFFAFAGKIGKVMHDEYGLPGFSAPKPYCYLGAEYLFNHIRSIKGFSIDLRKDPALLQAAIDKLQEIFFYPQLESIKKLPDGPDLNYCFDYDMHFLAPTVMSLAQFDKYYWPYAKQVFETLASKNMVMRLFTQGTNARLFDYFTDFPKGTVAIHSENDDVFEVRKRLPNVANIGGMTLTYLGSKTKEECIDRAKRLIDELGSEGGYILSQDKQISYKNDCRAENYKAVCDFVREYSPSQN